MMLGGHASAPALHFSYWPSRRLYFSPPILKPRCQLPPRAAGDFAGDGFKNAGRYRRQCRRDDGRRLRRFRARQKKRPAARIAVSISALRRHAHYAGRGARQRCRQDAARCAAVRQRAALRCSQARPGLIVGISGESMRFGGRASRPPVMPKAYI